MRRRVPFGLLTILAALGPRADADDEGAVPQPKSAPHGPTITLRRSPGDADALPIARVSLRQWLSWPDRTQTRTTELVARTASADSDERGRPRVRVEITLARVADDSADGAPQIRASGAAISVLASIGPDGLVADSRTEGADAFGDLRTYLQPTASWVLPPIPPKPVRLGDTWDVPIPYFLWSIRQPGGVPAEGFVTQVLEAVEDHGGVRCARIRTAVSLTRPQPAGMTPAALGLGDGPAIGRFHGSGTTWVDLTGCVREDILDVTLRTENPATEKWMEWKLRREVRARPTALGLPPTDWKPQQGKLAFTVGYAKGVEAAWAAARPAMLYFTSASSRECLAFGARSFADPQVLDASKAYLPILVDADEDADVARRYGATTLPAVFWVDVDEEVLVRCVGDAPIADFRPLSATARAYAARLAPSARRRATMAARDEMRAAEKRGDVGTALAAVSDLEEAGRPGSLLAEARATRARIQKAGREALAAATALARSGKAAEAKALYEKLVMGYGDDPVAAEAADRLRELDGGSK